VPGSTPRRGTRPVMSGAGLAARRPRSRPRRRSRRDRWPTRRTDDSRACCWRAQAPDRELANELEAPGRQVRPDRNSARMSSSSPARRSGSRGGRPPRRNQRWPRRRRA
jgi:hypothetical protein